MELLDEKKSEEKLLAALSIVTKATKGKETRPYRFEPILFYPRQIWILKDMDKFCIRGQSNDHIHNHPCKYLCFLSVIATTDWPYCRPFDFLPPSPSPPPWKEERSEMFHKSTRIYGKSILDRIGF